MAEFDVVVVGLGVMGSAALHSLARRGRRVIGIERFTPGHDRGSSHGLTRIIRLGYYEHPSYVPLVRRAYELWRDLEARSGRKLLTVSGILEMGAPESELIRGTLASSQLHSLRHEVLDAKTVMQRFPAFRIPPDFIGVFQPDGGSLAAEPAIDTQITLARTAGAEARFEDTALAIEPQGDRVRVITERSAIEAGSVIVAPGPWLETLLPGLADHVRVTRQVVLWVEPRAPALFAPDRCPIFMLESTHGIHYGFPLDPRAGLKVAKHFHQHETADPDHYERAITPHDQAEVRSVISEYLPAADGKLRSATTCLYTMTADGDFILDQLPGHPNIIVASPCSGHGFKFAPVIGDILADLATTGTTAHDISRFRLARFVG
jgi:sarcosine oxidase